MRTRTRLGVTLLGAALTAAVPLAASGGAQAAAPTAVAATAAVSSTHPYSDPVWYPVREQTQVGCGHSNPGCDSPHNFWTQILTPLGQRDADSTSHAGVFAMGAGIAHIGEANGDPCGSGDASFGSWVWVDHGGGTISRYGHLSTIGIRDGQLVAAGQQLAVMGVSGKRSGDSCYRSYLDFQLKKHGEHGTDYEFPTLLACRRGQLEIWPTAVSGDATWNRTPQGTVMPASDSACLPTAAPATVGKPTGVKLRNTKGDKLKASWTKAPAGVDTVRLEFALYHTSTKAWDAQHRSLWRDVNVASTGATYKVLNHRQYRVRVWFHTRGAGWSAASSWATAKVT